MKLHEIGLIEAVDENILISMLRRLEPMIAARRVYYKGTKPDGHPTLLLAWHIEPPFIEGYEPSLEIDTMAPTGYGVWKANIPLNLIDNYTIKSQGEGDSKVWTIEPKG